jgi:methionyl-tRNA formyltransferase
VPIASHETAGTLTEKLAVVGAPAMVAPLRRLAGDGVLATATQPAAGATYAAKIERADAAIDWRAGAVRIDRQIRAFNPAPGAYSSLGGEPVKLWRAEPRAEEAAGAPPGTIIAVTGGALTVATGDGVLRVAELQPAGGRRMTAPAFVAGRRLVAGARFDATPS